MSLDPGEGATKRVIVTRSFVGICHMQVCAVNGADDEEILRVCNSENPSGTSLGWCQVVHNSDDERNQRACADDGGRTHYLVAC